MIDTMEYLKVIEDEVRGVWRPADTAPKDGIEILVYRSDAGVFIARWDQAVSFMTEREIDASPMSDEDLHEPGWFFADFIQGDRLDGDLMFTHWQPMPAEPDGK